MVEKKKRNYSSKVNLCRLLFSPFPYYFIIATSFPLSPLLLDDRVDPLAAWNELFKRILIHADGLCIMLYAREYVDSMLELNHLHATIKTIQNGNVFIIEMIVVGAIEWKCIDNKRVMAFLSKYSLMYCIIYIIHLLTLSS